MEWSRISDDAKNLIQKMLTFDVESRISASQALNNEWIQKNAPNDPLNSNVLLNLGNFHVNTKPFFSFLNEKIKRQKANYNRPYALLSQHKF